ncbi:MAG: efflux transporter outer membrane subunit, partial [Gammaproteobacteria bacterium]|nr:efflux transporter outer membrane subunit [Gammaproteobacteria bacterium]
MSRKLKKQLKATVIEINVKKALQDSTTGHRSARHIAAILLAATTTLQGCQTLKGPAYVEPTAPDKVRWVGNAASPGAAIDQPRRIDLAWWRGFNDKTLNGLVDRALTGDFTVRILELRLQQAGIGIEEAEARRLPTLRATLGGNFTHTGGTTSRSYALDNALNWEFDLWGKAKKGVKSKEALYRASEADWRAGQLTLVSSVASQYFGLLLLDEQYRNQLRTVEHNQKLLRIYRAQLAEGLIPESRVRSQVAELASLTSEKLNLERQRRVAELQLATLIGTPAGELSIPAGQLTGHVTAPEVPVGLPSDLLTRRPDILAKGYGVLAAHELVGQAHLARLPSVSLTATGGTASNVLSSLLKVWTFGLAPSINIPIFDPGVKLNIRSRTIDMKVAEEEYKRTIVKAYEEVETALVNLQFRRAQMDRLTEQTSQLRIVQRAQ